MVDICRTIRDNFAMLEITKNILWISLIMQLYACVIWRINMLRITFTSKDVTCQWLLGLSVE